MQWSPFVAYLVQIICLGNSIKPAFCQTSEEEFPNNQYLHMFQKLEPNAWIDGRDPAAKLNLISWLIDGCFFYNSTKENFKKCSFSSTMHTNLSLENSEYQTFDGFFNNVFKVDLGAVDTPLLRRAASAYEDGTYMPSNMNKTNPLKISAKLMTRKPVCGTKDAPTACGSKTGKSAFMVFFGQQVVEEILDSQRPACPPEYFNIKIPPLRESIGIRKAEMPFLRTRWDQNTGRSPGNSRQQLNEITPWIDGGLVYGTSKGWADVLRTRKNGSLVEHGLLASENDDGYFPVRNHVRLPLANPPPPAYHSNYTKAHETAKVDRFFVLGNPRGNENPFILSFGVVLFRWHNQIAKYLHDSRPTWSGDKIFQEARKWVIATYQQIVVYDWLPEFLGESLDPYRGYDPSLDPQIEQFFQTAAMRFGHTLVPPAVYMRDYACANCVPIPFYGLNDPANFNANIKPFINRKNVHAIRTCNSFWRPQEPMEMSYIQHQCSHPDKKQRFADIDPILMGMASQRAEREDNMIVEDLRGNVFGPLEFSRRDLMAINIQRGRDHGIPDYNTAREAFNLPRINSVVEFMSLTGTHTSIRDVLLMEQLHGKNAAEAWKNIDVWTGGLLETSDRPGPLFRAIIKDQFTRIRNADRFWFENTQWTTKRFTSEQIARIRTLSVFDMVVSVTRMLEEDIQPNPFKIPDAAHVKRFPNCFNRNGWWEPIQCGIYNKHGVRRGSVRCASFPQLLSDELQVENCTSFGSYDYFSGSEIPYIFTYLGIGLFTLTVAVALPMLKQFSKLRTTSDTTIQLEIQFRESNLSTSSDVNMSIPLSAKEWQGYEEGTRPVVLFFTPKDQLVIRSHEGDVLRTMDFCSKKSIELIILANNRHIIIKNPTEYDCVLEFNSTYLRDTFLKIMEKRLTKWLTIRQRHGTLRQALSSTVTKKKRLLRLEKFFKLVFAQAFYIDKPKGSQALEDPKVIKEVIHTELTKEEFADALGINKDSQFVEKMFDLVDRDKNGYISFREFLDMLIVFVKGSAEDKAKLMFDMYDIEQKGSISTDEFKCMISSMVEAANADIKHEDLEDLVKSILQSSKVKDNSQVTLIQFQKLMLRHKETLGYAQLNFSGVSTAPVLQKSHYQAARNTIISIYSDPAISHEGENKPTLATAGSGRQSEPEFNVTTSSQESNENDFYKYIESYSKQIFWGLLYTLVVMAIFAERAYVYGVESEHKGLRHIAGYGVSVTRGAASAMMFTYATLLLTMCRNIITRLRETFLHRLIPFDSFINMHKYIAYLGLLFTTIHVVGHAFNFYHISTQTSQDLACLFRDYYRPTHVLPKFQFWCFQTITGITGVLLVLQAVLIYTFSTSYARNYSFRLFWIMHRSYPLWYMLTILHGSGRLVQAPIFGYFLSGPLVLFIIDKLISTSRKRIQIPVLKADLLPSNVTKLEFPKPAEFEYKSGQWVRIACKDINSNEFHPFTLSSAPHEPNLTLHIRAVGPFTRSIRKIYEKSLPRIYLDGAYGEGHQDWWRYEVSVLIGGGIGVTPFASILKDVTANSNGRKCKKIYFMWVTRTQKQFEWMVDIIREVENHALISAHVFITQIYDKFDLRTVLLYICERHFQRVSNRSLFTGLKSVTHFGRPDFQSFFNSLQRLHPKVKTFGVFSCGPAPMTKCVETACVAISSRNKEDGNESGANFKHHFENF